MWLFGCASFEALVFLIRHECLRMLMPLLRSAINLLAEAFHISASGHALGGFIYYSTQPMPLGALPHSFPLKISYARMCLWRGNKNFFIKSKKANIFVRWGGGSILNARPHPVRGMASGSCPQIPERSLWKTFHVNVSQQKWQLAMHTSLLLFLLFLSIHIYLRGVGVDVTNATCMTNQLPIQTDYDMCNHLRVAAK